jgi:hypothetical protein
VISRAAPIAMPHFQFSQWAQDCVALSDQPLRRSNSATSISQRWFAALMWPVSVQISLASSSRECIGTPRHEL